VPAVSSRRKLRDEHMTQRRFPRSSRWRRGYHRGQVDAFLAQVDLSLQGTLPPMAASDVRQAGFELVRHGYAVAAVDAHLDELEERVLVVEGATSGRRGRTDQDSDVHFLRDQLDKPHMRRFPRSHMLRRGYDLDQVDELVDRVLARLGDAGRDNAGRDNAGRDNAGRDNEPVGLTVEDVRAAGFKSRRGGYAEQPVDETLDRVVELLLVQRRAVDGSMARQLQEPDVGAIGPPM
jgi:DivIVA domain-containing protein